MIRYSLLWLSVGGLMAYAWKDWCRALCLMVVMLALFERPDMPRTMLGIPGLNPFNLALIGIMTACLFTSPSQGLRWDLPRHFNLLLFVFVSVIVVGFGRLVVDRDALRGSLALFNQRVPGVGQLTIDNLLNTTKFMIPGILLAFGCRDRQRIKFALLCLGALYVLLAIQVINQMPLSYALDGEALQQRALRVLDRRVGYHRVDLAMILSGAPWLLLSARYLTTSRAARIALAGLSVIAFVGLALTGGRTGYLSWAAAGAVLCVLRWRHYLLVAPAAVVVALVFLPGIADRMLQGVHVEADAGDTSSSVVVGEAEVNADAMTSGRSNMWPYVVKKILASPWIGYGRMGHERSGVAEQVYWETGEFFGHPHNAYLEFALDNGIPVTLLVLAFFGAALYKSMRLFRDRQDPLAAAVGGATTALLVAFLAACIGAQHLYPITGTVGLWCAIGLTTRVWHQRRLATGALLPVSGAAPSRPARAIVPTTPARVPSANAAKPKIAARERSRDHVTRLRSSAPKAGVRSIDRTTQVRVPQFPQRPLRANNREEQKKRS